MEQLELPEEVQALLQETEAVSDEKRDQLGKLIAKKREEAVAGRKESGIEEQWVAAEEAYLGIDDSNRAEWGRAKWIKPTSMTGPITTDTYKQAGEVKSTVYVRLTSRYVDAGAAKLSEILLPIDGKAFSFGPTPNPDLIKAANDLTQVVSEGQALTRDARPNELPAAASPSGGALPPSPIGVASPPASPEAAAGNTPQIPPQVPLTVKDLVEEQVALAIEKAQKAEKRVYDWMVEAQYPAEMRKVIFDASRIGVGVLKAPFPTERKGMSVSKLAGGVALQIKKSIVPDFKWKSPWNIYPDPACGENIHDGDYLLERDFFTAKQLRNLKGQPGYNSRAIDRVLEEGPDKAYKESNGNPNDNKVRKNRYEVWFHYGTITKKDLELYGDVDEKTPDEVYAICTLVNDTVIHAVMNPLDSGSFPYHSVPWQRRAGFWAGVGVGEQVTVPQRMINAATRSWMNNAGKSAGSIIVLDQGAIVPADGKWTITPDKIFYRAPDATIDDVRKMFATFQVPNMGPQLQAIVEYALRLAEESTNIPLVTQGQSGSTTPETYGATQLQNNNANQLLRSIGYAFDDFITVPVVKQAYEWLLLDPEVPDDEKGDYVIDAHGSVALIEQAIQDQTITQMAQFALNPAFGVNPKRWFAQFMKSKHLNPKEFLNTPEEQQKIDSQPPAPPPPVQVAQIRADIEAKKMQQQGQLAQAQMEMEREVEHLDNAAAMQIADLKRQTDELRIKRDTDRDTVYVQAEQARTSNEYAARMREIEVRRELAILEYANKRELQLNEVKAQLAETSARLQVQRELSGLGHKVDLHKHQNPPPEKGAAPRATPTPAITPLAEPAGKAAPGQAFVQ